MIGLIFGDTDFPKEILKKVKKKRIKYIIIDLSKRNNFKNEKNSYKLSIGQFGKIINIIKLNKCSNVLFAGKVNKPNLSKIKLDIKGIYYIPRIIKSFQIGDAAILKEVIRILKENKINTVNSLKYSPDLSLKKGRYSKIKPNAKDKINIKKGIITLKKIGKYNSSQGVVVRDKKIVAIEGKGGTQKMLLKCKNKKNKSKGVLIKLPKQKQDLRIDLPAVGLKTFIQCKKAGLGGIVIKSKQNIFLEKQKCINYANKNKMFILSI